MARSLPSCKQLWKQILFHILNRKIQSLTFILQGSGWKEDFLVQAAYPVWEPSSAQHVVLVF